MFTLYMKWDAGCDLAPGDIQFILTPRDALEMASVFYELDYLNMTLKPVFNILPSPGDVTAYTTASRHSHTNASATLNTTAFMMK